MLPYLAMSYLYKRSNRIWHWLIKHDQVHAVWRPLVESTRRRHLCDTEPPSTSRPLRPPRTPAAARLFAGV